MNPLQTPTWLVTRLAIVDFIRRKDFYVVAAFMILFAAAALTVRLIGIDKPSTARFLMSAGLGLAHLLSACLAASFGARAMPEEFENGTLLPLLAKAVSRRQVLSGKLQACRVLVLASYLMFVGVTLLCVPITEGQRVVALLQVVCLTMIGLTLLTTMSVALSFHAPIAVSALVSLFWYFGAGVVGNLVLESVENAAAAGVLERLLSMLPDPSLLIHTECFASSSSVLGPGLFAWLVVYGAGWSLILFGWSVYRFEKAGI